MVRNHRHITGLLTLLISLSLGFSTIHNHDPQSGEQESAVAHTLDIDSSLCPICGYLMQADISTQPSVECIIHEYPTLHHFTSQVTTPTFVKINQERAPPVQV